MAAIFGFGGGTNFLLGVVLAEDGQDLLQVVSVTTFMAILCVFFVHVLSCSIFFLFLVLM